METNKEDLAFWHRLSQLDHSDGWTAILEWITVQSEMREHQVFSGTMHGEDLSYMLGQCNMLRALANLPEEARAILTLRQEAQDG